MRNIEGEREPVRENGNAFELLALHSGRYLNWWFREDPDLPR